MSDSRMAFCGLPMYWKKPEETILESGYRECEERYLQSHFGYAQQRGVVGEHTGHEVGKEVAQNEAEGGDAYGAHDVQFQCPDDAVELTGAVVVAHDGLHALVESVHNHHEEHQHAVHDAVGADGDIAARFFEGIVDKDDDDAGADVEQERGHGRWRAPCVRWCR